MFKLTPIIVGILLSSNANAFDLEDYAGTYRQERNSYWSGLNSFYLALYPMKEVDAMAKSLESACYRFTKYDYKANLNGLLTGSCNKDGESAHPTGGVYNNGNQKVGDLIADLINILPYSSTTAVNLEDPLTNYRAANDTLFDSFKSSNAFVVEEIPNCVPSNPFLAQIIASEPGFLEDFESTHRGVMDAFINASNAVQLGTAPYKAAEAAYQAAATVYVQSSNCEDSYGIQSDLYDSDLYDWN